MFLAMLSLLLSFTFFLLNHPMSVGLTLLIQVILVSLITNLLMTNFWFSYILFLIMIGGMLVLFIYMTSIASNEKFLYSNMLTMCMILLLLFMMGVLFMCENILTDKILINIESMNFDFMFTLNLSKFLNFPLNFLLLMIIIYLFITLIAVVKITNIKFGPLRQKF
uniref:NADH-ubiquinone oxidoreductase chain 6 n=1 Tax=Staphylinidae sp. 1 EF-2015 TaxID=1756865 RepID=A0A0S2M927_9COLE|nr:NADH deshydrogenase subunit 6 [Staphylinidae sp. 1 EF-2015]